MDENAAESQSIQVVIQRQVTEHGFVNVMVTEELFGDDDKLDTKKLFESAVAVAADENMVWYREDETRRVHPTQFNRGDKKTFYAYYNGMPADIE